MGQIWFNVTSTGNADVSKILYNGIPNVGSYTRMV
jgi:hypothetical protein